MGLSHFFSIFHFMGCIYSVLFEKPNKGLWPLTITCILKSFEWKFVKFWKDPAETRDLTLFCCLARVLSTLLFPYKIFPLFISNPKWEVLAKFLLHFHHGTQREEYAWNAIVVRKPLFLPLGQTTILAVGFTGAVVFR